MNVKRSLKVIEKYFEKDLGLNVESKLENNLAKVTAEVTFNKLNNAYVVIVVGIYENGSFYMDFVFDKPKDINSIYEPINRLNASQCWVRGFIGSQGFFQISHNAVEIIDDINLKRVMSYVFETVVSDNYIQYLKPIVDNLR